MVKVMKSPNMMSTTGRIPVMAAPTASPVKPASEIGVSSTRSFPNSSSRPERTLNGVPASATSSPMMQTVRSRRISSARASRIACAKVSSRAFSPVEWLSGIYVLGHFNNGRIGCGHCKIDCLLHLGFKFGLYSSERGRISEFLFDEPLPKIRDGISLGFPHLFFLLGTVILAIDVADVVTVVAIGVAEQKCRTISPASAIHESLANAIHGANILTVHAGRLQTKGHCSHQNVPGSSFRIMRVLRVEIVLADIDHGKFEKLGEIHHFVEHTLAQRAFSKKTYCHAPVAESLRRKCSTRRNSRAAAHNRVRSQVASSRVRNVHGTAFAFAVPGLFP